MPTYTIEFDQEETEAIYSMLEQVPLPKSHGKRLSHNIQYKIENAQPNVVVEPEPEQAPDEVVPPTEPEPVVE